MPAATRGSKAAGRAGASPASNIPEEVFESIVQAAVEFCREVHNRRHLAELTACRDTTERRAQDVIRELESFREEAVGHRELVNSSVKDWPKMLAAVQDTQAKYQAATDLAISQLDQRLVDEVNVLEKQIASISLRLDTAQETLRTEAHSMDRRLKEAADQQITGLKDMSGKLAALSDKLATETAKLEEVMAGVETNKQTLETTLADLHKGLAAAQTASTAAVERLSQQVTDELAQLEQSVDSREHTSIKLAPDMVEFVRELLVRKEDIMSLLDGNACAAARTGGTDQPTPDRSPSEPRENQDTATTPPTNEIEADTPEAQDNTPQPSGQVGSWPTKRFLVVGELLQKCHMLYKALPPRSESKFIWDFLDAIKDIPWKRHIQKMLLEDHPTVVSKIRGKPNSKAHEITFRTLTWAHVCDTLTRMNVQSLPDDLK